ncbi:MAG: EamA family transporter [Nitrospinae bacterium]|nr:EamA family transporter [Nitrospinota bacterium]MZH04491.1 EamA family transporter [Nitrospinota bacterium]MZH13481.1 EamA family transporter [Nitrospinota bacterium]
MNRTVEHHFLRGILLSAVTALLWGILPIILKISLQGFTSGTIAWFRFSLAFVILGIFLSFKGHRPLNILKTPPWMGIFGGLCLAANYYWVTLAVDMSGPSNMAVLIQTASVFLVITGVLVFHERLLPRQVLGMFIAAAGLILFFFDQQSRVSNNSYVYADFLIQLAALVWVGYMISQKFLSRSYGAQPLNFLVYAVATLVLAGTVEWREFASAGFNPWLALVFCGINTLLAYGALAEAVKYLPLAIISVIISLNPLITLLGMKILPEMGFANLQPDLVGMMGYWGGAIAVTGVTLVVYKATP